MRENTRKLLLQNLYQSPLLCVVEAKKDDFEQSSTYAETQLETILGILQQISTQMTVNLTVRQRTP